MTWNRLNALPLMAHLVDSGTPRADEELTRLSKMVRQQLNSIDYIPQFELICTL